MNAYIDISLRLCFLDFCKGEAETWISQTKAKS